MALPVSAILAAIPWGTVIEKAPLVVARARDLWKLIGKDDTAPKPVTPLDLTPENIEHYVALLEQRTTDLHQQVTSMSELIVQLSEQNASLVQRCDANRKYIRLSMAIAGAALAIAVYLVMQG